MTEQPLLLFKGCESYDHLVHIRFYVLFGTREQVIITCKFTRHNSLISPTLRPVKKNEP